MVVRERQCAAEMSTTLGKTMFEGVAGDFPRALDLFEMI
jgi:hypothetical protein